MRRGLLFINLTFVLAAAALLSSQQQALADDAQAQEAIKLLARSEALDTKCKFLNAADRDTLSTLMARAELAMAKRTTVDITRNAMATGHAAGKNAVCTESEHADLTVILSSAKHAAAQASNPQIKAQVAAAAPIKPITAPPKMLNIKTNLAQYASITERYYLARRCGSMSSREITEFYQTVVSIHQAVLAMFGRSAVAAVMRQSEAKAIGQRCS